MVSAADLHGLKILFVAHYYLPTSGTGIPGSMRTIKFVRNLANGNCHVLTVKPDSSLAAESALEHLQPPINGETIHRAGNVDIFGTLLRIRKRIKGVLSKQDSAAKAKSESVFKNTDSTQPSNPGMLQRLKDFAYYASYFPDQASPWILRAIWKGRRVVRRREIDVIFSTGSPWSGLLVGYCLSRLSGKPFVADFRDPWIGNPFHHSKGRLLDRLAENLESRIVEHASLVSLNTDALHDEFLDRYPHLKPDKFIVLPNGYDLKDFEWLEAESKTSPDTGVLELCHAGFLYGVRDPAPLLEAIRIVNQEDRSGGTRVVFTQVGSVQLGYDIRDRFADLLKDGSLRLVPQMAYKDCLKLQANSDVLVNIQPGTKTQVPSKIYDYLALNRPILNITPKEGALGRMVQKYGFGDLVDPEDSTELAAILRNLASSKGDTPSFKPYEHREAFDIARVSERLAQGFVEVSRR